MKSMDPWKPAPSPGPDRRRITLWPGIAAMLLAALLLGLFMARIITAQTLFPLLMLVIAPLIGYLIVIDVDRPSHRRPPYREVPPPADIFSVWPPLPGTIDRRPGKHRK
ncbi:hypothetical protein SAMN02927924_00102 [Sphingobium faniae]|nr:hypothetical protein SAMN02927924_00102 [Sphingobium faniae]